MYCKGTLYTINTISDVNNLSHNEEHLDVSKSIKMFILKENMVKTK